MKHVVVSYIPALHRGYIDFFKKHLGTLYILSQDFVREVPRMDRDIRALTPEEVRDLIAGLRIFSKVTVLNGGNLSELVDASPTIIMPDDEVNRAFAKTWINNRNVTFVPTFLRWDRQISTKEFEVLPDRIISEADFDKKIMSCAFKEAEKSPDWWRQIGAILIREKKPVITSHNAPLLSEYTLNTFGDPRSNFDAGEVEYKDFSKFIHAEASLIAEAARRGISTEGASLYVTTFPCPACAKSIAIAGIKEVYYSKGYSLLDAEDIFRAFKIKVILIK